MKQLVILSGKGGTGKTSITASFAHLAHAGALNAVFADADVDAANLELVLSPSISEKHDFMSGKVARIDQEECICCNLCKQVCRFDAVLESEGRYQIDPIACEGCAACAHQCPTSAIRMDLQLAGHWFRSQSRYGPLFHAALRPAQENSGKLVTLVKQQARLLAMDEKYPLIIVDGPPGIGCPAISAISGADMALIIAEPSLSGVHDMERAVQMAQHFQVPVAVCINKEDIFFEGASQIENYCKQENIEVIGRIPFDPNITEAMVNGEPVSAFRPDTPSSREIESIWQNLVNILQVNQKYS